MRQDRTVEQRRRIPPGHRSITGSLPSRYPSGPLLYESKLERDFLLLMQIDHCVHDVITQPTTMELSVEGKRRTYTPDVLVTWHEAMRNPFARRQVMFEVKPLAVLRQKYASLAPKYREARRHLARQGIGFRVVTERTIQTPRLANAELLAPTLRSPVDQAMQARVRSLVRHVGTQRLGDVRRQLEDEGFIRSAVLKAAYNLIAIRFLVCDLTRPITDETEITWWTDTPMEETVEGT